MSITSITYPQTTDTTSKIDIGGNVFAWLPIKYTVKNNIYPVRDGASTLLFATVSDAGGFAQIEFESSELSDYWNRNGYVKIEGSTHYDGVYRIKYKDYNYYTLTIVIDTAYVGTDTGTGLFEFHNYKNKITVYSEIDGVEDTREMFVVPTRDEYANENIAEFDISPAIRSFLSDKKRGLPFTTESSNFLKSNNYLFWIEVDEVWDEPDEYGVITIITQPSAINDPRLTNNFNVYLDGRGAAMSYDSNSTPFYMQYIFGNTGNDGCRKLSDYSYIPYFEGYPCFVPIGVPSIYYDTLGDMYFVTPNKITALKSNGGGEEISTFPYGLQGKNFFHFNLQDKLELHSGFDYGSLFTIRATVAKSGLEPNLPQSTYIISRVVTVRPPCFKPDGSGVTKVPLYVCWFNSKGGIDSWVFEADYDEEISNESLLSDVYNYEDFDGTTTFEQAYQLAVSKVTSRRVITARSYDVDRRFISGLQGLITSQGAFMRTYDGGTVLDSKFINVKVSDGNYKFAGTYEKKINLTITFELLRYENSQIDK